ncbi:DUF5658 family protein [Geoglobus ahangari]
MKGKTTIFSLILIFMILNVFDLVLTISAVHGGKGHEANPVMAYLLENSTLMFMAVKITAGLFISVLLFKLYRKHVKAARITSMIIVVAYLLIVTNNLAVVNAEIIYEEGKFLHDTSGQNIYNYDLTSLLETTTTTFETTINRISLDFSKYKSVDNIVIDYTGSYEIYTPVGFTESIGYGAEFELRDQNNVYVARGIFYLYPSISRVILDFIDFNTTYTKTHNYKTTLKIVFTTSKYFKTTVPVKYDNSLTSGYAFKYEGLPVAYKYISLKHNYIINKVNQVTVKITAKTGLLNVTYVYYYDTNSASGYLKIDRNNSEASSKLSIQYFDGTTYFWENETSFNYESFNVSIYYPIYKLHVEWGSYHDERAFNLPTINQTSTNQTGTSTVTFYFFDAETGALIPNVNFTLAESNISNVIVNGTFDYSYKATNLKETEIYIYNASGSGYLPEEGYVYFPTGEETVYIYLTPVKSPTDSNNSIVTFTVKASIKGTDQTQPLAYAVVTLNGESKLTNSQGYVSFEVPKNNAYSWLVQADGYFSKAGEITVNQSYHRVTVVLDPLITTPTSTATATPSSTGGTTIGGTGRGSLDNGINLLYENAEGLIGMALLVTIMGFLKMMSGRR